VDRQEEVQTLEIYRIHQNSILDDLRRVATAIYCHPLPLCDALLNSGVVLALYVQVVIPGLCKQDWHDLTCSQNIPKKCDLENCTLTRELREPAHWSNRHMFHSFQLIPTLSSHFFCLAAHGTLKGPCNDKIVHNFARKQYWRHLKTRTSMRHCFNLSHFAAYFIDLYRSYSRELLFICLRGLQCYLKIESSSLVVTWSWWQIDENRFENRFENRLKSWKKQIIQKIHSVFIDVSACLS